MNVQVSADKKKIAGGRLVVMITGGGKILLQVRGSTTNRQGIAQARFVVPRGTGGRVLNAQSLVTYHRHVHIGNNSVKVHV